MNWFERYGFAGSYSLGLIFLYMKLFIPTYISSDEKVILGIGAFFFLPFGYVVSICAQWLVYHLPCRRYHIHLNLLSHLRDSKINNIPSPDELNTEIKAESWLAMRYRDDASLGLAWDSKNAIMEWARKRWDVMSINASLLLSSYCFIIISLISESVNLRTKSFLDDPTLWMSLLSVIAVIIAIHLSRGFMRYQLMLVLIDLFTTHFNRGSANIQPPTTQTLPQPVK